MVSFDIDASTKQLNKSYIFSRPLLGKLGGYLFHTFVSPLTTVQRTVAKCDSIFFCIKSEYMIQI